MQWLRGATDGLIEHGQAIPLNRLQMGAARDQYHFMPMRGEPRRDDATDRARTNDRNPALCRCRYQPPLPVVWVVV